MDIKSLHKISDYIWEIPVEGDMKVPGRIFASAELVEELEDNVVNQIKNVAALPGLQQASIAMPDAHWGYGFPIGGVAAMDDDAGASNSGCPAPLSASEISVQVRAGCSRRRFRISLASSAARSSRISSTSST